MLRRTRSPRAKDPLAPLEVAVQAILALWVALLVMFPVTYLMGAHPTFGEWGDYEACVTTSQSGVHGFFTRDPEAARYQHLAPGVQLRPTNDVRVCQEHMSGLDRTLLSLPPLLGLLWLIGFLLLTLGLIRQARRHGLFTHATARRTTQLGWYLLAGTLTLSLLGALLKTVVVTQLVTPEMPLPFIVPFQNNIEIDWPVVVAGAGVITVGRVMRQTVPMREEIEATV